MLEDTQGLKESGRCAPACGPQPPTLGPHTALPALQPSAPHVSPSKASVGPVLSHWLGSPLPSWNAPPSPRFSLPHLWCPEGSRAPLHLTHGQICFGVYPLPRYCPHSICRPETLSPVTSRGWWWGGPHPGAQAPRSPADPCSGPAHSCVSSKLQHKGLLVPFLPSPQRPRKPSQVRGRLKMHSAQSGPLPKAHTCQLVSPLGHTAPWLKASWGQTVLFLLHLGWVSACRSGSCPFWNKTTWC